MDRKKPIINTRESVLCKDAALEIFSGDAFLAVNKRLLSEYGPELSIYLSSMIDWYKYCIQKGKTVSGEWFLLNHDWQSKRTGMNEYKIRKCKNKLKEMGVIQTKIERNPMRQWLRIRWNMLFKMTRLHEFPGSLHRRIPTPSSSNIDDGKLKKGTPENGDLTWNKNKQSSVSPTSSNIDDGTYKDNYKETIKEKKYQKKKKFSIPERNSKYKPLAEKLAEIIQSNKNIKITHSQKNSWADEIRKLIETQGVSPERVQKVLNWYQDNIGGEFVPVVASGVSLRSKFIRMEDAIHRQRKGFSKKDSGNRAFGDERKVYPC